jgi:hypothetical protein
MCAANNIQQSKLDGVEKILVASTSHLSVVDCTRLKSVGEDNDTFPFRVITHKYGWIIPVSSDHCSENRTDVAQLLVGEAKLSETFLGLYLRACESGCSFICFDADGEVLNGVPVYEW